MAIAQANADTILDAAQGTSIAKSAGDISLTTAVPADGDTVTVNGVLITFQSTVTDPATEVDVGASIDDTVTNLAAFLQASTDPLLNVATYTADTVGDSVDIEYKVAGTVGDAFTLEATFATTGNVTINGAAAVNGDGTQTTLTGGAETGATKYMTDDVTGGLLSESRLDDTFEANLVAAIALAEFAILTSVDPTSNFAEARRQRKMLKEALTKFAANIVTAADSSSDDRVATGNKAATSALNRFNLRVRDSEISDGV